jgi:hypothetical protein
MQNIENNLDDDKIREKESLEYNKKEFTENIKIDNNKTYYEKDIDNKEFGICFNCKEPQTEENWCLNCNSKFFKKNFGEWTSGNMCVDKFIQEAQLNARNSNEVIEWINHERLENVQFIAKGGFSDIYRANWLDGCIDCWNYDKKDWNRITQKNGTHVILKSLNDSSNIHEDFLNEVKDLILLFLNIFFMINSNFIYYF